MPSSSGGFAVIDLETTGLFPGGNDRVIEVAVVKLTSDLVTEGEYVSLVNPGRDLGPTHIHGVRGVDARNAPPFEEVADDIVEHLRGRTLVGHNVEFDLRFLHAEFERLDLVFPRVPAIDTQRITGKSLSASCERLGINHQDAHSALGDATATADLFRKLAERFPRSMKGIDAATDDGLFPPSDEAWPVLPFSPTSYTRSDSAKDETHEPVQIEIEEGMAVCFTGESQIVLNGVPLTRALEMQLASEAGLIVKSGVSKKVSFVVAVDVYSLSGKARKAQERGIPIVQQVAFWRSLGMTVRDR